ncbi:MAG TPA: glycosyltransferase [Thermoanaerobaculia bacterium]|nr:glycosyltransferase [Thermoanaerobaculia bacterium]
MRFLILNTDYSAFLESLYAANPGLESRQYRDQMETRFQTLFGVADFYSRNLAAAGHEAETIFPNNARAQRAWALENGLAVSEQAPPSRAAAAMRAWFRRAPRPVVGLARRAAGRLLPLRAQFDTAILREQIRRYRPDVLINQAVDGIPSSFIREMRPFVRLMVGHLSAPMPNDRRFDAYDLMISSLPSYVAYFRSMGLASELHPYAFEPRVLDRLDSAQSSVPVSFVGSFSPIHQTRTALLEYLAETVDLQVWGNPAEPIPRRSPLHGRYHGPAFGIDMYRVLRASAATVNFHIVEVSGPYAANMRLFEATGSGTLLVTDWKENLHELFEPERDVVTFRSKEECREKIEHFLARKEERDAVAAAGQARTLRDHTYAVRMAQLADTLRKYL